MKTLDELHLRLDAWLIAYAGATRADIDVGTVRDARDALRELIADAARWRYWRNLWPALTKMDVAAFAGLDLTRTYVDSPEKMDEVTDAARKG